MAILEEMVQSIGFEVDSSEVKEFRSNVVATTTKLAGLAAGAAVAAQAITSVLQAAGETAGAVRFARSIDVAFDALQRLEFAGGQVGTSVGSIRSALDGLGRAARGAASGLDDSAIENFALLGVEVEDAMGRIKSADKLLLDVADRVANATDPAFARSIAESLGLGADLNLLLRLGADGIKDLGDEGARLGAILGQDAAEASDAFAKKMDRLRKAANALLLRVGLPLVEWATSLLDRFEDIAKTDAVQTALRAIGEALRFVGSALSLLLEPFKVASGVMREFGGELDDAFGGILEKAPSIESVLKRLGVSVGVLMNPLLAAGAMLNELRTFLEGGDSLLGRGLEAGGVDTNALRSGLSERFRSAIQGAGSLFSGGLPAIPAGTPPVAGGLVGSGLGTVSAPITQSVEIMIDGARNPDMVGQSVRRALEDLLREAREDVVSPFDK